MASLGPGGDGSHQPGRQRRGSKVEPPDFEGCRPSSQKNTEYLAVPVLGSSPQTADTPHGRTKEEGRFSKCIPESLLLDPGPPARYQLSVRRENLDRDSDEESKLRRFTYGTNNPQHQNRTVLLVGATGSGKSTLINALVNFVMGVRFEDRVWFEIVVDEKDRPQSETQTTAVSVYEVFGFENQTVPYSLTIIDTPGYGDTRGVEYDNIIAVKLKDLFSMPDSVDTIDAVALVLQASENRLDNRKVYIFNCVTSLFGKDMEQKIVALMTHSNGMKPKNALRALDEAKIKCSRDKNNEPVHFLFNNSLTEMTEDTTDEAILKAEFETSDSGMKKFTEFLGKSKPQSLKTTVEVLTQRVRLTACIQNLKERVGDIETQQEAVKANKKELSKTVQEAKTKQKDYTFNKQETYKEKEQIDSWFDNKAVTCSRCEENCHYPGCTWAFSPRLCEVMKKGKCTACTGKCPVKDHVREKWKYVTKTRTVETTIKKKKVKSIQTEKELSDLEKKKKKYVDKAFQHILKLDQIALNVNAMSTYVHLEFLMEKMKDRGDTEKVQTLQRLGERMDEKNLAGAKYFQRISIV